MAAYKARAHGNGNRKKAMSLDWAHTPRTDIQHQTTGPYMESSGQEENRTRTFHETRPHN